jgi:hypothetical protein
MIRCVQCGCSRLDSQGVGCALCGGAPAVGWEQCYIDEATKAKLLAHAAELKAAVRRFEKEVTQAKAAAKKAKA